MTAPAEVRRPRLHPPIAGSPRPLALFGAMWAMAVLLHQLADPRGLEGLRSGSWSGLVAWLLTMSAIGLLLRPGDLRVLGVVSALQLVDLTLAAPVVGNHWVLAGLISLAVLVSLGRGQAGFFDRFAPTARVTLLVAYGWVAFAKLNPAFVDPVTSCAVRFAGDLTDPFGLDTTRLAGSGWARLIPIVVLAIELAIPLLVLVRRTRTAGVVVAVVFHLVVGLDAGRHFWDFSAVLFALYVLFLPATFADEVARRFGRVGVALRQGAGSLAGAAAVLAVFVSDDVPRTVGHLIWLAYGAAVVLAVVGFARRPRPGADGALRVPTLVLAAIPVLALVNGLTPYLEVKSAYGFTMYSNLHVAGGETNHYLLGGTVPIDDRGGDLVTIRDTTDPGLRFYAETGWAVAASELAGYLADHPDVSLVYERGGRLFALEGAGDDPRLGSAPGWLERRLRPLRAVDPDGHPPCQDVWGPAR